MRIPVTMWFPLAVAVLECGAGVVYLCHRQWAQAVVWLFYSVAAAALALWK